MSNWFQKLFGGGEENKTKQAEKQAEKIVAASPTAPAPSTNEPVSPLPTPPPPASSNEPSQNNQIPPTPDAPSSAVQTEPDQPAQTRPTESVRKDPPIINQELASPTQVMQSQESEDKRSHGRQAFSDFAKNRLDDIEFDRAEKITDREEANEDYLEDVQDFIEDLEKESKEELSEWQQKLHEARMVQKYGQQESLVFGNINKLKRFFNGDYEKPWSKLSGKYKWAGKTLLGGTATALGILYGAPTAAIFGGAFLLRGGVEGIKKLLRNMNGKEGIGLDEQLKLVIPAQCAYAEQLAQELVEKHDVTDKDFYEKVYNFIDFKAKAERGDVDVEFYKDEKGKTHARVANKNANEKAFKTEKVQNIFKKDSRSDLIFGLIEAGAGIAGGGIAGSLALLKGAEAAGAVVGHAATLSTKGWLANISTDTATKTALEKIPGLAKDFTDYHKLIEDASGTIKFVRTAAEMQLPGVAGQHLGSLGNTYDTGVKVFNIINEWNTAMAVLGGASAIEMLTKPIEYSGKNKLTPAQVEQQKNYENMLGSFKSSKEEAEKEEAAENNQAQQAEETKKKVEAEKDKFVNDTVKKERLRPGAIFSFESDGVKAQKITPDMMFIIDKQTKDGLVLRLISKSNNDALINQKKIDLKWQDIGTNCVFTKIADDINLLREQQGIKEVKIEHDPNDMLKSVEYDLSMGRKVCLTLNKDNLTDLPLDERGRTIDYGSYRVLNLHTNLNKIELVNEDDKNRVIHFAQLPWFLTHADLLKTIVSGEKSATPKPATNKPVIETVSGADDQRPKEVEKDKKKKGKNSGDNRPRGNQGQAEPQKPASEPRAQKQPEASTPVEKQPESAMAAEIKKIREELKRQNEAIEEMRSDQGY